MKCEEVLRNKYDFIDGYLSLKKSASVKSHLDTCKRCMDDFRQEEELLAAFRNLPVPPPSDGFADRVLQKARTENLNQKKKSRISQWGAAMAAGIILCILVGVPVYKNMHPQVIISPALSIHINEQKVVQLLVNTPQDLLNAKVIVQLPQHVEMVGFPGLSEIEWNADLLKGKNLLRLPLIAKTPGEAKLVTRINHQNKSKLLKFDMKVYNEPVKGSIENKQQYIVLNHYVRPPVC